MSDNSDSHQLFTVVAAVHHERVGEALDDGALSLAESLDGIAAGGVGDVDWRADLNVIAAWVDRVSAESFQLAQRRHDCMLRWNNNCFAAWYAHVSCRALEPMGGSRQRDIPDFHILVTPLVE